MLKKNEKLDQTDIDILNILQEDGRRSQKEIAYLLKKPISGIYDRLKKLERLSFIDRYHIRIDRASLRKSFDVHILVRLKKNDALSVLAFKKTLNELAHIYECSHSSGAWDFILKGNFRYMDELRHLLDNELSKCRLIRKTSQLIILSNTTFTRPVCLEEMADQHAKVSELNGAASGFYKPLTAN